MDPDGAAMAAGVSINGCPGCDFFDPQPIIIGIVIIDLRPLEDVVTVRLESIFNLGTVNQRNSLEIRVAVRTNSSIS